MKSSDRLFTGRSENYSKFRPSYPVGIVKMLTDKYGLKKEMVIADIGCGTGILARMFLENGNKVYCIDPNGEMLKFAKDELSSFGNAIIVRGSAENTGLEDHSVNVISAGQSFHWFDTDKAKVEFRRILTAPYMVVLIWNDRDIDDGFTAEYEKIVSAYGKNYQGTGSTGLPPDTIPQFFNWAYDYYQYQNYQELDLEGLKGRYLSTFYSITQEYPKFQAAMKALETAFNAFSVDGKVRIRYITKVFVGKLNP
ncbi:hypothetical protein [Thermoplasma volcanium GSS1]|uniref:Methyltransferase type 11 domain-containing protein n=1 Tax=Thermoplasma volcanium (strain ATCC 51530 / DSM 4299 / JCM 9571 / NBRC 15438 / GSS1) TaxID=273116 RepID=Q97C58_THEVO|nr:class I SAM-dependent methyltransferase [Thermoplasma volcanium]BAB59389.1 hypothetical protein [Thermoplasma volcanium GSS1]